MRSVLCHRFSDDLEFCAVTFRGPSCELWNVENGKSAGLGLVIKGASGSKSAKGTRCGKQSYRGSYRLPPAQRPTLHRLLTSA